jgi:hypothetical protein
MHDVIDIALKWAAERENRFMVFLLLFGLAGGLVIVGTSAYDAWRANLPWMGWDLRRKRR